MVFKKPQTDKPKSEYEQKTIEIARVARVVAGGRRFSFRVTMGLGDRKGRVGLGVARGQDVAAAINKAVRRGTKSMVKIHIEKGTIAHDTQVKYKSAKVLLRPAAPGKGIVAGGVVRIICDLVGIQDIVGKILGKSANKINIARATIQGLQQLKQVKHTNSHSIVS